MAHFAKVGPRLCPGPGGTLNPRDGKLAGMESSDRRLAWSAEEAGEPAGRGTDLLTAEEAAVLLRVGLKFIYAHAAELGGFRLLGDRGPWRFTLAELQRRQFSAPQRVPPRRSVRARGARNRERTRTPSGAPLLPAEPRREAR